MKETGKDHFKVGLPEKTCWTDNLNPKDLVDHLPIMNAQSQGPRVSVPIHNSTEVIADMIREQHPELKFKRNLDVYKSFLYAGRQVFERAYLKDKAQSKLNKKYKMAKIMESAELSIHDAKWLEGALEILLEGYLSRGQGQFERDKIIVTIEELKPLLSEELQGRCDNFIDEDLDAPDVQRRAKDRLRQRECRKRKENIRIVK